MKRSGTIWLVVGVVAAAAVLMYFVVLPQMRDGKTVEEIAKKAEEAVKDVKQAVNDAGKQVEEAADGAQAAKTAALAKMARIGQDAKTAADQLQAVLDKDAPTIEEINAAKTKLRSALLDISALEIPKDAESTAVTAATKVSDGAKAALAALDKLPEDPVAAKAALAEIRTKLLATLPQGDAVTPADAAVPTVTEDSAAKTQVKADEQKADGATETDKPADAAKAAVPAFDILRVEKDGSTVIAGRAEPGAKIEIVDGDKVIASAEADVAGDFAAVLDNPLTAGDHSIVLKATTKDGKSTISEEVATVSVPKDASGELLAMVTKPGEASKIITAPEAKDTEIAANKGVTQDASKDAKTADGATTAQDAAKTAETAKAETQDAAKADVTKVEEAAKTTTDGAADTAAKVAVETPDLPATSTDIASTPPVVTQDDAAGKTQEQQTAKVDQVTPDTSTATPADSVTQADDKPVGAPEVMVTAVELEGDKIYIAGSTRPGATVRLYADDQIVAETTSDGDGRFVADGTIKLAVGDHTIRADVLSGDGSKVELRASVPFFRPEGDLAAVASNDTTKDSPAMEPLADGAFDRARDEADKALGLLQGLYAGGNMPSAEELAAARSSAEIALKSLAEVRVPADVDPALAAMAAKASDEAGKALDRLKAVPADVKAFKSALGDVETIVSSAVKPATEVASASDSVKAVSEPAKQATATTDEANPADNAKPVDQAKAADEAKPADEAKQADTSATTTTAKTVDKAEAQVSADDVQVTAKVDRLKSADVAKAEVEKNTTEDTVSKPADGASATTAADARTAGDTADATTSQTASQETASADQPKVIEQAPLKQSEGSVIIRKGDTLWQISRRVYGKGVRYTTIYVANKTQINDPDRIMPGQIFSMPGKWLENSEELHKEHLQHHQKP